MNGVVCVLPCRVTCTPTDFFVLSRLLMVIDCKKHIVRISPVESLTMASNDARVCARFANPQLLQQPFGEKGGGSSFVADWYHRYSHKSPNEKIELAALGIEHEGRLLGESDEAQYLATQLREVAGRSWETIITKFLELYTRECFLYRLINRTLRENNFSKVETLGPFCWFLQNAPFCELLASKCYTGCVY